MLRRASKNTVLRLRLLEQRVQRDEAPEILRLRELLRAAEEANRLKDHFLATVSHELRTPLSSILGWAKLLQEGRCDPAFAAKGLDVIERNARAQQRIIDDMLDVSRIIAGKLRIDTEPVDVTALAHDVIESMRPTASAKEVALSLDTVSGHCRLAGDSMRLRQVLDNLLSNAVKFTPRGGRVVVSVDQHGDRVVVRITDTGKGIDPSFLPHVFETFRQADTSMSREHGGLGLGLGIVRHLAEMHGGTVGVESDGLGAGATFSVTLPVRPFSAPIAQVVPIDEGSEARPRQRPQRLADLCVLIVEDEADSRELIELLLASEGALVRSAASADQALALLDAVAPDVILSDIGMPGRDGYWLARQVRARRPDIAAIALTAFSGHDDIERAFSAGFDQHVAKPVDPELLVNALTACGRTPLHPRRASTAA
jgi:CheY-like chemotaxis protein/nitrogen-specific signal transduction histidine kinase